MKIAVIFGTRPEAIKIAPVVYELRRLAAAGADVEPRVFVSAQHRDLLDQVLGLFGIEPDADLDAMRPAQDLMGLTSRMLQGLHELMKQDLPDLVLVHGDTTTALAGALAAYYLKVPVGHIEAGLRTRNRYSPFPEEMNRHLVDVLSTYHFAPTFRAADNLRAEGVAPANVFVTGNTGIDALLITRDRVASKGPGWLRSQEPGLARVLESGRRIVLVTSHRRENFGSGLAGICEAILSLVRRFPDIEVVYPVHPNPQVRETTGRMLAGRDRVHLLAPLGYDVFCHLMDRSHLILTDSGGIQEEAPSLDKPVLVLRQTSERPEAVEAGAALVVGTRPGAILDAASRLLADTVEYRRMAAAPNPYGDGRAARRIVASLNVPMVAQREVTV
jgi:UDP-N-acetylglucosamine 2-epimerase (non-hydrolysing)